MYRAKEADCEAPTVWSRPEVKKIQYGGGGMVLKWLDFGEKGSLGLGVYGWESTPNQPYILVWSVGCCRSRDIT
jgi:hypothetical protein